MPRSTIGEFSALVLMAGHHAGGALEVKQGFLQLGVDHVAVGHHQHGVEHLLGLGIVQLGQKVRRPGNRIGFARACAVLDQVLAAGAISQHSHLQLARDVQLVVAREDDFLDLLFLVALGNQVAAQNLQPTVTRPNLFPQVGGTVAAGRPFKNSTRSMLFSLFSE